MPEKQPSPELLFDVASAVSIGKRDYQEDAIATDFPQGGNVGFAVLADGMGGHAAGDIASKIVVTEVFSELKFQAGDSAAFSENAAEILRAAALGANSCVKAHASNNPETTGMGSTLVAPVFVGNHMFWISIGDSPMYLFRNNELQQLNEDHSLAPQIDMMVNAGLIDEELARNHPDRNCLTSVIIGGEVEKIDCPDKATQIYHDDMIIVASDGLQTLCESELQDLLRLSSDKPSAEIVGLLVRALEDADDPAQDNASFCVIKATDPSSNAQSAPSEEPRRRKTAEIVPMPSSAARTLVAEAKLQSDAAKK